MKCTLLHSRQSISWRFHETIPGFRTSCGGRSIARAFGHFLVFCSGIREIIGDSILKGVIFSVGASVLFAVLYYYAVLLAPLDGSQILGWRVVLSLPGLLLILTLTQGWHQLRLLLRRIPREPALWAVMPACAAILGFQLWLFMWAPLHNMAMDVSLGYFLLPLIMVVVGRVFLDERLSGLQTAAVIFALVGVAHELWRTATFSWATAGVCLLFPVYFLMRRVFRIEAVPGLMVDMLLIMPFAVMILATGDTFNLMAEHIKLFALVPLLGIISTTALFLYLSAGRLLPMGLFGLLGYVEPVLLFFVATLLLREPFAASQWLTYGPVWIAVGLLVVEGTRALAKGQAGKQR